MDQNIDTSNTTNKQKYRHNTEIEKATVQE